MTYNYVWQPIAFVNWKMLVGSACTATKLGSLSEEETKLIIVFVFQTRRTRQLFSDKAKQTYLE